MHGTQPLDPHYVFLMLRQNTTSTVSGEMKIVLSFFHLFFFDFMKKLVHFLSNQIMVTFSILLYFLKIDPCPLERILAFPIIRVL